MPLSSVCKTAFILTKSWCRNARLYSQLCFGSLTREREKIKINKYTGWFRLTATYITPNSLAVMVILSDTSFSNTAPSNAPLTPHKYLSKADSFQSLNWSHLISPERLYQVLSHYQETSLFGLENGPQILNLCLFPGKNGRQRRS